MYLCLNNSFKMLVRGVFRHQYVLKFKNVWNWSERGGQHFSNKSEIQKSLKYPIGGVKPIWENVLNFSVFFILTPPLYILYILSFQEMLVLHELIMFPINKPRLRPCSAISWVLSTAENFASSSLQDGVTMWHYFQPWRGDSMWNHWEKTQRSRNRFKLFGSLS